MNKRTTAERQKDRPVGVIAVAGMPRSGSTWQFNATRLLLEDAKVQHWSGWVKEFDAARAPVRLVKVHNPADFQRKARLTLTTWRPFSECLQSLIRMEWLEPEKHAVQKAYHRQRALYHHWAYLSGHETDQWDLVEDPEKAIAAIQTVLEDVFGIPARPRRPFRVAEKLAGLRAPEKPDVEENGTILNREKRHDPETLLHPDHIGSGNSIELDQIEEWIEGLR